MVGTLQEYAIQAFRVHDVLTVIFVYDVLTVVN
jgi:hypothetical protein